MLMIDAALRTLAPAVELPTLSVWTPPAGFVGPGALVKRHARLQASPALPDVVALEFGPFLRRLKALRVIGSAGSGGRGFVSFPEPGACLVHVGAEHLADAYAEIEEAARQARLLFFDPGTAEMVLPCRLGATATLAAALAQLGRQWQGCLLCEGEDAHAYVQLYHGDGGAVRVELPSNCYLPPDRRLDPGQLARLASAGWAKPSSDEGHLTRTVDLESRSGCRAAAVAIAAALSEAFGLRPDDQLFLCLDDPGQALADFDASDGLPPTNGECAHHGNDEASPHPADPRSRG